MPFSELQWAIIGAFPPSVPSLRLLDEGSGSCASNMNARPHVPRLKLLLNQEPAHRIFFSNLTDTLLRRTVAQVTTTSRPGPFWNDVFVYSGMPWRSFFESVLWHVLVVAVVWSLFWRAPRETAQQKMFRESHIVYYPPSKSFPTVESRRPRVRPQPKLQSKSAAQPKIVVTPERSAHSLILPPDLKLAASGRSASVASRIAASHPTLPAMPLSATGRSRRAMAPGLVAAVAPSPDVNQTTTRRLGLPQTAAVAPAPEVRAASARRVVGAPNTAVVAPPPTVESSIRRVGDVNIGHSEAVAPAPRLPMNEQRTIPGRTEAGLAGTSAGVVPPPPSVGDAGMLEKGRASGLSSAGLQAVPPAPAIKSGDYSAAGRRANSLSTAGAQVVPPTPSVDGVGGGTASGRASPLSGGGVQAIPPTPSIAGGSNSRVGGRGKSLSSTGMQVVPPPPALSAGGDSGLGGSGSLSTEGMRVVPPAPSVNGMGSSTGAGRGNSLSNAGLQVVPPSPAVDGSGNSNGAESPMATNVPQEVAPPPVQATTDDRSQPAVQELPVNLIGLVLALPGTSYFSNYEVFVARRRLGKDETTLIKLVYEFLPYQSRLSEIGLKNAKVYKLTVVRDTTCDETLMQMLNPQIDETHPGTKYSFDPAILGPNDPNSVLPCYRTTADDFRKALSKAH
jgi:hypothetical protein